MSIKYFVASVIFSAMVSLAALVSMLKYINPETIVGWWLVLFYVVFFLFCVSVFVLLGLAGRKILFRRRLNIAHFMNAFRQALLFSLLLTGCLALQSSQLLVWWNALLLVGAVIFLEFCFLVC